MGAAVTAKVATAGGKVGSYIGEKIGDYVDNN